jgi:P-type Cu2+ transporter
MESVMTDYGGYISHTEDGKMRLRLAVEGISCAGCAMKIENALNAKPGVEARVNVTRKQLTLVWNGNAARGGALVSETEKLGFRFSPIANENSDGAEEKFLLRCLAIAGFSSGNIMIFSLALWFSNRDSMGSATQDLFHWFCALISLPTVVYAGRPFFSSAWNALRHYRTNMDVPISVGVILATGMSLYETIYHGAYVYFDAAVMLLFLLLAGRYLDRQTRGRARAAAANILALNSGTVSVMVNGSPRRMPAEELRPGMTVIAASGERIFADGLVQSGISAVDTAALTGETERRAVKTGDTVLAGMINLEGPLTIIVQKSPADSLAGEVVALMQKAEQGNAAYVRLADRISRYYTPVVHLLALGTFLLWWGVMALPWQQALMTAVTVLIITCPCALGLAVPIVQVLASQWLFRRGLLVKAADAFERMAKTDTVVFDKTGVLTAEGMEAEAGEIPSDALRLAASVAAHSGHPLARAIAAKWSGELLPLGNISETAGEGISASYEGRNIRLGSRRFCGIGEETAAGIGPEAWFSDGRHPPLRIGFRAALRPGARETVAFLRKRGLRVLMVSGDRHGAAQEVARELEIDEFHAEANPKLKLEIIEGLQKEGRHVMMVGDGINDAAALLRANCSLSPSSAMEVSQNAADVIFQGKSLKSVLYALQAAVFCQRLVKQNFVLALSYNVIALPLAITGYVTPLIAAVAMSCSSLFVTFNALRFNSMKEE